MELPKLNNSNKTAEQGVTIVKQTIETKLNWLFRRTHQEEDFGIDGFIDIITDNGHVTGKSIAVQIKTGESFFNSKNEIGWIFRGQIKHLNYYLNHDIPVVVILVNEKTGVAYWNLCDGKLVQRTGESWTMTIPFKHVLEEKSKTKLLDCVGPIIDYASQLENYWEMNNKFKDGGRIVFIIERGQIESLKYNQIIEAFERLEVNEELLLSCKNKVDIAIDGYDNDSRELNEIPEVINWVNYLNAYVLGLAYFLSIDEDAQFLRTIQLCKIKYKITNTYEKNAISLLNKDLKETEASLIDEPNEHIIHFTKTTYHDSILIQGFTFDKFNGRPLFDRIDISIQPNFVIETNLRRLTIQFCNLFDHFKETYGLDGYRDRWRHSFPSDKLVDLRSNWC
jgi:hypothetical protein